MTPYEEALLFIERNPGTGGAMSLAKLILSLWNDDYCHSFRECISSLDEQNTAIAVRMTSHFARFGEDNQLVAIGHKVSDLYPRLWELAQVTNRAKAEKRRAWQEEDLRGEDE